jgi:hypothetical protein
MSIFKSKRLEQEVAEVKRAGENTAAELGKVKIRQANIERRLNFLKQELQVQQRTFND